MNTRCFAILLLLLVPCALRAQSSTAAVRVGDTIELRLAGVPPDESAAFNGSYTIDDDGMISLPLINKVKVAGLLPNQIQEEIQNRYVEEKFYTHPTVTVQENQVPRYVNIIGEVNSHGARIPYTADMTLMTVISAAGGFTDFANKKAVELTRDGKPTVYNTVNITKGKEEDPKVLPGDQITVKQSSGLPF